MLDTLHIEDNGVPIYVQIRDQILAAIGAGRLKPGERLPTMREVAVKLKIDLNTVRHAYEVIQESGAIILVPARGSYVADNPPPLDAESRRIKLDRFAEQTAATANAAGIDLLQLINRLNKIARGPSPEGETQ